MPKENARILVIGAGVNGSVLASGLKRAGIDVTLMARGKRLEELTEQGIVIETPLKKTHIMTRVPLISTLTPDDVYDYILVVVRKNQVPDLLPVLAQNSSPNVAFLVNNPSGPEIYTKALTPERVLLGFVFAGGKRDGSIIRAIGGPGDPVGTTPFGEIDGSISPRVKRLVALLNQAGFKARISTQIVDYLVTHAAMVAPLAQILIKNRADNKVLAHNTEDLRLLVDALREIPAVLRANGFKVIPASDDTLYHILPKFLMVMILRYFFTTRFAEIGAAWHCQQAPDEMHQLGLELMELVKRSNLPCPALHRVYNT